MSFAAYPDYKGSGVPWLGAVPSHWAIARFKNLLRERDARSESGSEELLSVSAYTGVTPKSDSTSEGEFLSRAESLEGYKICKRNDLVMNIMLAWNRGLGVTKYDGIVSPAYCVFELGSDLHPDFCNYALRADEYTGYFKAHSAGVIDSRLRLYPDKFGALLCTYPPIAEQASIIAFLDRETTKIDALVAEQERLIALLKEKRQAVISHAVTKGLNPSVPMKESGIEWLGEIPAHWIVSKLFHGAKLQSGYAFASADFGSDGVPVVRMNNLSRGKLDLSEAVRIPESALMPAVALSKGDLVWGMSGSVGETGSLGNFAIVSAEDLPCQLNQRVGRFVVNTSRMTAEFLEIWIQSYPFYQQILLAVTGTAQYNVSAEQVQSTMIGFPPIEEQLRICEHVASVVYSFGELLAEAQSAITLLQERRAALISAAVTGKIDVRGLAETSQELELA